MRTYTQVIALFICVAAVGLFSACDNIIGLGDRLNTSVPVINVPEDPDGVSQPGSFLYGTDNIILLDVIQEFGINSVYMTMEYTDLDGMKKEAVVPAYWDREQGFYAVNIDTIDLQMADGKFIAWVTAVDISGNKTITTEMIYIVKNLPPQIELMIPAIKGKDFDQDNLNTLLLNDPLFVGFDLMGMALDNLGIELGYPKIMIWPADLPAHQLDSDGLPLDARYKTYRSAVVSNATRGLTATRFTWPMVNLIPDPAAEGGYRLPKEGEKYNYLSPKNYRFRIVTRDIHGKVNYYPNRSDNTRGPGGAPLDPDTIGPKYMEISYVAAEIPIISIRNIPQYCNGTENFTVDLNITSQNPLSSVQAYVTDSNDGDETYISNPPYEVARIGLDSNPYVYQLTITPGQMADWPKPADGNLYLHFSAVDDTAKQSPPAYRNFIYDTVPAEVKFDRPVNIAGPKATGALEGGSYAIYYPSAPGPRWVTGRITVGGLSTDDFGIDKVYYHIGKLGDDNVPDSQRKLLYGNSAVWQDTRLDTQIPDPGWSGSPYAWTYSYNFNDFKKQHPGLIQEDTEIGYAVSDADYGTTGKNRFYLPFYVKVTDNAGNQKVVHYKLCIDPDLDIPLVTINYPGEGNLVGGEVRLSGTAADNEWVHTVQIRIKKAGQSGYYMPQGTTPFYPNPGFPDGGDSAGWFRAVKIGDDMVVGWYYNINGDNGLNPPSGQDSIGVSIEVRAVDAKPQTDPTNPDLVGPIETLNITFSSLVPTITSPKIIKQNIEPRDYFEGIRASGNFTLSMIIGDKEGLRNVRARIGGAPYTNLIKDKIVQTPLPLGWSISVPSKNPANENRWESTVTFQIDSTNTSLYPALGYGGTGSLNLEVIVENISEPPFKTNGAYNIGVDNFYPNMEIKTQTNASGKTFQIEGSAKDYGGGAQSVQGLEKVLVYFQKAKISYTTPGNPETRLVTGNGPYLNPRNIAIPAAGSGAGDAFYNKTIYTGSGINWGSQMPAMVSCPDVRDVKQPNGYGGVNGPNVAEFPNFPLLKIINKGGNIGEVWESPHAMVIDSQELGADVDYDEDGTSGEVWSGLLDKEWMARMNTKLFDDGPYMVHIIVMDQAGNATYDRRDIYIENKKPWIESINLGTDIDGDGNVSEWTDEDDPGEFKQHHTVIGMTTAGNQKITFDPSFRIRNRRFSLRLNSSGGNGTKYYRVSHVTADSSAVPAAKMQRGQVYTIAVSGATDWQKYGALNNNVGTTFVASGPGEGSGSVTRYAEIKSTAPVSFGGGHAVANALVFTAGDFGSASYLIPDSLKNNAGEITTHNQRLFIVKVYDSAVGGTVIEDQLAHAVLLALDIDNDDAEAPTIDAAPFGREYVLRPYVSGGTVPSPANNKDKVLNSASDPKYLYSNNIVCAANGEMQGYVQYAGHSLSGTGTPVVPGTPGIADISGKVIFTGKAADNQRIKRITARIPGYNSGVEFDIAEWQAGRLVSVNGKTIQQMAADDTIEWAFEAAEDHLTLEYGHAVNWKFAWDSSTVSGTTALNVLAAFKVYDFNAANDSKTIPDKLAADIVPYISELVTGLSSAYLSRPSAFNRSALGWYPVREDETVLIKGFNFSGTLTSVTVNGTALDSVTVVGGKPRTQISARIDNDYIEGNGNTIVSGPLLVTVGGISSINNRNNKIAAYNMEPNGLNNNILTNDRHLYVWNTGALVNNNQLTSPFMRMDSKGNIYMTYGKGSDSMYFYKNGEIPEYLEQCYNKFHNTTVAFDTNGNMYGGATNTDRISNIVGGATSFTFYSRARGSQFSGTSSHYKDGTNKRHLELSYNEHTQTYDINRVKIPRIAVTNAGTVADPARIFMSYFDGNNNNSPVIFRYGTVTGNDDIGGGISSNLSNNNPGTAAGAQIVADSGTGYKGGLYTAVGGLSTGRAVIAWYDAVYQRLVFSYSPTTAPANTTTAQWQNNARVIDNDFAGWHVDLTVDGDDGIHIAYYTNGSGGLRYAYLSAYDSAPKVVRVDTYLSAGTKLMINTRREQRTVNGTPNVWVHVPYISYYHASFPQTKNSVRVAWRANFDKLLDGTDNVDCFTGAWESMTIPAATVPTEDFVCNGVAASGTLSSGNLTGATLANTVLLGYHTDQYYERAYLKK